MADPFPTRLVVLSPAAARDYADNHENTVHFWGREQAQKYSDFLDAAMLKAAGEPGRGRRVERHSVARTVYMKWSKAKHGHYIVYRPINDGIYVMRILHGRQDFPNILDKE